MCRTAIARVAWGRDHPAFAAWTAASGVPDGERDLWLCSVCQLARPRMLCCDHPRRHAGGGDSGRRPPPVRRRLDGKRSGWPAATGHASWHAPGTRPRGRRGTWRDRLVDPRYAYSTDRFIGDHAIGDDEALALGHLTLAAAWVEKHNRRRAAGHRTAPEIAEENARLRSRAIAPPAGWSQPAGDSTASWALSRLGQGAALPTRGTTADRRLPPCWASFPRVGVVQTPSTSRSAGCCGGSRIYGARRGRRSGC